MFRPPIDMSFAVALLASVVVHVAALLGPGWALPGFDETEESPPIEAVLTRPAIRPAPAPARVPRKPRRATDHPVAAAVPPLAPAGESMVAPAFSPSGAAEPPAVPANAATEASPPLAAPTAQPVTATEPETVAIALPSKGRVRYSVTRGEGGFVIGQTVQEWEHDGRTYRLRAFMETTGLAALFKPARVAQASSGEINVDGLRPVEFRHERLKGVDSATLDWAKGVVAYAGREEALPAGTQDMLSMYYQLVLHLPRTGGLELPIATGRKLERYRFDVVGEEKLQLRIGERNAIKLRTRNGEDLIELWISPEVQGLPLKIRFVDRNGELFDQIAEEIDLQETQ